jgi:prophage maintenance system killer protein
MVPLPRISSQLFSTSGRSGVTYFFTFPNPPSPFNLACVLMNGLCVDIAKNNPFNDSNKRTALLATRAFLYLNGQELEPRQEDEEE